MAVLLDGQEYLLTFTKQRRHKCHIFITFIEKISDFTLFGSVLINFY